LSTVRKNGKNYSHSRKCYLRQVVGEKMQIKMSRVTDDGEQLDWQDSSKNTYIKPPS
jgi:hypothetical protein